MNLNINNKTLFVFDLDDTLFHEIDYLTSAFKEIATLFDKNIILPKMLEWYHQKEDVFANLIRENPETSYTKEQLLTIYRNHKPEIQLQNGARQILENLFSNQIKMILVTDGRSITQRNKIASLQLTRYFEAIFISEETGTEKKEGFTFQKINNQYKGYTIYSIGDNINKDFEWPKKLGWTAIGIRNSGKNIHTQEISSQSCPPDYYINSFTELYLQYE